MAWYRCVGGAGGSLKLRTASGPIATFETNIETAFVSLKSEINPVQDLHGYSKPWSGGGGKNKLQITATTQTINGITFTIDNEGVITTSGTFSENTNVAATTNFFLKAGTYILNGCPSGGSYSKYVLRIENGSAQRLALDTGNGEQFTLAEDTYVWCRVYIYSQDGVGKTFKPMVRLASVSDASFEPYSNICPISGFSALNVTRTGVNLLDSSTLQNLVSDYDYAEVGYRCRRIQLKPNTKYTVKTTSATAETSPIILINNKTAVNTSPFVDLRTTSSVQTYTTDATGCLYIGIYPNVSDATANARIANCNIEIVLGETEPTTYEPYNGQTATVNFGQTVYGGVADITNGKLTITHKVLSVDNNSALYSSGNSAYLNITDAKIVNEYASAISDKYEYNTWSGATNGDNNYFTLYQNTAWSNARLAFNRNGLSLADFITSLTNNPIQVVYELATPIEITTTPENLTALSGQTNNVYGDTNGDMEVKYLYRE